MMLLCLVATGCSSIVDEEQESAETLKVGDRLPLFTVNVTDGDRQAVFDSSQLTGETVIVFFHTSCSDCQRELPVLNQYYLKHKDDAGFQMVAISREEGQESIAAYWKEHGLQIPYSPQADRGIYHLFATTYIPRVYCCTAQGIITRIFIEKLPEGGLEN